MKILRVGYQGPEVLILKKALTGFDFKIDDMSDTFDKKTEIAVEVFQSMHGLKQDGEVGPLTQAALGAAPKPGTIPEHSDHPWLEWMKSHIGEPEVTGSEPTAFDRMVFSHTNFGPLGHHMEAGCAASLCAALELTGYKSSHNAAAASFDHVGQPCELSVGCITTFEWASGERHVSICSKIIDNETAEFTGGNQSHLVKPSIYLRGYIKATRWPDKA